MSETNGYANPAELFTPQKRNYADIDIDGLGKFRLRDLNAEEAAGYAADRFTKQGELRRAGLITANARIIVLCCVDNEGNLLFNRDDVPRLQELPAGRVAVTVSAVVRFSHTRFAPVWATNASRSPSPSRSPRVMS